jgi:hypothetical protein
MNFVTRVSKIEDLRARKLKAKSEKLRARSEKREARSEKPRPS